MRRIKPAYDYRDCGIELCEPYKSKRYNIYDAKTTIGLNAPGGGFCNRTIIKAISYVPSLSTVYHVSRTTCDWPLLYNSI
ncbi:hypothetical protein BDV38DRAFT_142632 [Aspergillus pseudotamarii]|uniref:Uncharacterized protein n=1 Tax=Aspergillus pseudotamarii TaxID=132259 RepID=A0A5N6SN35_ASPPS|nr:uncharacterized protein BDV38DRAFT_142632 [Aspergillus pseudotamarii]KAE8135121.1 hypothetical protein BDV38DRAFT_142632 [Aspergillus pseudotamarii]